MTVTLRALPATALACGLLVVTAPAALAQQACEEYSQGCEPGSGVVDLPGGNEDVTPPARNRTGTAGGAGTAAGGGEELPFTGGEVTSIALLGLGALAGGTALVVAARRRSA